MTTFIATMAPHRTCRRDVRLCLSAMAVAWACVPGGWAPAAADDQQPTGFTPADISIGEPIALPVAPPAPLPAAPSPPGEVEQPTPPEAVVAPPFVATAATTWLLRGVAIVLTIAASLAAVAGGSERGRDRHE
ncbi:hypothetical protein EBR56_08670 [bacterium]|nr:hypothetical protein [bacterium]